MKSKIKIILIILMSLLLLTLIYFKSNINNFKNNNTKSSEYSDLSFDEKLKTLENHIYGRMKVYDEEIDISSFNFIYNELSEEEINSIKEVINKVKTKAEFSDTILNVDWIIGENDTWDTIKVTYNNPMSDVDFINKLELFEKELTYNIERFETKINISKYKFYSNLLSDEEMNQIVNSINNIKNNDDIEDITWNDDDEGEWNYIDINYSNPYVTAHFDTKYEDLKTYLYENIKTKKTIDITKFILIPTKMSDEDINRVIALLKEYKENPEFEDIIYNISWDYSNSYIWNINVEYKSIYSNLSFDHVLEALDKALDKGFSLEKKEIKLLAHGIDKSRMSIEQKKEILLKTKEVMKRYDYVEKVDYIYDENTLIKAIPKYYPPEPVKKITLTESLMKKIEKDLLAYLRKNKNSSTFNFDLMKYNIFQKSLSESDNTKFHEIINDISNSSEFIYLDGPMVNIDISDRRGSKYSNITYKRTMSVSKANSYISAMNKEAEKIAKNARKYKTKYDQAKYVYEYLAKNSTYTLNLPSSYKHLEDTAYPILVHKNGKCSSYSAAYHYILTTKLNIPVAYGRKFRHIWNIVKINGEWYHVDVTWAYDKTNKKINYNNFMKGNIYFRSTHKGSYYSSTYKTSNYSLKHDIKPRKVEQNKIIAGRRKATITWKKTKNARKYIIYMSSSKNGKFKKIKTIIGEDKVKYTKTKLKKNKKYYFKIRAYRSYGSIKQYGAYSIVRSVKVK